MSNSSKKSTSQLHLKQEDHKVSVNSEIGALRRVIVHRPDEGISRVSPKKAGELLFDDIVHLPQMQEEHDVFTQILKAFIGEENVLETQQLLLEGLEADPDSKQEMINLIVDYEELPTWYKKMLQDLPNSALTETLITGYLPSEDQILFDPIPNFLFTRDLAVTVNDHVVITKAARAARFRENFLTRFIFYAHPTFKELRDHGRLINLNKVDLFPPSKTGETLSIEGGDMMTLNEDYLLIGRSERTNEHAINSLKKALFERKAVYNVVQIDIPAERSYMHIDTLFTQINHNHITAFKPVVVDGLGSEVIVHRLNGASTTYPDIKAFFHGEISSNIEFLLCGGGTSPYQEREQWTDGCNLVTIRPGVALTYDRNPKTEEVFRQYGYEVVHARDLLQQFKEGKRKADDVQNCIITLPSNELSRARGGSHCMTCPIQRDII